MSNAAIILIGGCRLFKGELNLGLYVIHVILNHLEQCHGSQYSLIQESRQQGEAFV